MTKDELIEALQALPASTATAVVVFHINDEEDDTVESVDYEHGEVVLNIESRDTEKEY